MMEVLNPLLGDLFERLAAPTISNKGFLQRTLPHLQTSRGGSAPGAQPAAVVKLLSIFAALEKQRDEWAKNEEIQVLQYVSIIKDAYNGELEEVRRNLQRNGEAINERTQAGRNALHAASANGHLEIVQLLIEANLTIDGNDASGITPLRMAVAGNHVEVTKYLLRQTADPNIADHNGWTPLHSAALNGHADIIKCLKASGADVTKQTGLGYTPLFLASSNGHVDCVKELIKIEAGTNELEAERCCYQLDMVDGAGFSALHCAALKGHAELTKLLLQEGVSAEQKSESGMVPLTLAAAEGHLSCVRELLPSTDFDDVTEAIATAVTRGQNNILRYIMVATDEHMWSILHNAAWKGETELIRSLIEDGGIDDQAGEQGCTPLLLAIWQDNLECVKIIIEEGNANVNKPDNNSCSPLHIAVELKNKEVMGVLLGKGARPDGLTNEGKAPLHDACFKGDLDAIKLLMNAGADFDIKVSKDSTTQTPLQFAARGGHIECVKLLLDKGARIETPGPERYSALLAAASRNKVEVIKYLLGKNAELHVTDKKGDSVLFWAALYNNIDLLKKCLEDGQIDINTKNSSGQTALHVASGFGHIEAVKLLLDNGAEINTKDEDECTPLHNAAECNRDEVIQYLVEHGADIQTKECEGQSPLHRAASLGSLDSVKMLLKMGADIGAKADDETTPLHLAVAEITGDPDLDFLLELGTQFLHGPREKRNNAKCVEYLLDNRADINAADDVGYTPLIFAAAKSVYDCAEVLISRGADMDAKSARESTALHIAVRGGHSEILRLILSQSSQSDEQTKKRLEAVNKDKWTPLQEAICNAEVECVRLLCDYGANLEAPSISGKTPLYRAVEVESMEIVKLLLEKGVNINTGATLYGNETPLHFAVRNGYRDIVELLIEHGADLDARITTNDYNVFHIASETGQEECLQILVNSVIGIDGGDGDTEQPLDRRLLINSTLKTGLTPLHCAILGGHLGCVKILCDAGANVEAQSISGKTPLQRATEKKHVDVMKYLLAVPADVNKCNNTGITALHIAASNGFAEPLGTLLESNADVNAQSKGGWTPLHMSVKAGHVEITSILIAYGSNINAETENGSAPILIAAEWNQPEILQYLIENGVSVDRTNKMGYTALLLASSRGHPGCIDFLSQNGAEVNKQSNHNSTPLLLAAENGHQSCVEKLIALGADPTKRDNDGDSLLHVASLGGRLETLEYVLDLEGMSELIPSKNNKGQLPLHCAARQGHVECVELLLALGVSQEEGEESCPLMDEQDCQGKTPLHLAVEGGFSPVIEALIEAGADLNIQTNDGKTCLHLVVTLWGGPDNSDKIVLTTNGFESVSSGYPEYEPLTESEKLLLYLLDKGAICATFDGSGNTPIHYTNTHRLWQLIVSRIPEEERSNLLAALALKSEDIKRTVKKTIGPDGGEIELNLYGVRMTIPAGALDDDQEIIMKLLGSPPEPAIQEGEMLASFGVQLNPCGLNFKKPVQIRLPHCAKIASTSPVEMVLYHSRDGEMTTMDMVSQDLSNIPAVVVQERDFVLHIGEFCELFAGFKNLFLGKNVRCSISSRPCSGSECHDLKITLADDIPNENFTTDGFKQICSSECTYFYVKRIIADVSIAVFDNKSEELTESVTENKIFRSIKSDTYFFQIDTDSFTQLHVRLFHGEKAKIPCIKPGKVMREQPTPGPTPVNISAQKLNDDQLMKVSKKISHEKYNDLSVQLGCSLILANNILVKHCKDYEKALLEVLMKWNQQTTCDHMNLLIMALEKAGVAGQISEIFPVRQCE